MRVEKLIFKAKKELADAWERMTFVVNGHIGFGQPSLASPSVPVQDNIDGVWVSFVSSGGDQVVPHTLGRVPSGYIIMMRSTPCDITNGGGSVGITGTSKTITLRSSVTGAAVQAFII